MPYIAPIVEGHGEVEAVPALLQRIAQIWAPDCLLEVNRPIRVKAGSFLGDSKYFAKYIILASSKAAQEGGLVLVLLDCEDDCPGTLGPSILERSQAVRNDVPYLVVLAYREYESWFLAAARSLRGLRGLPANLEPPKDVEAIRDAKGWLGTRMAVPYDPVTHQPEFTHRFDLSDARANFSFDRLCRHITAILVNQK